MTGGKLRKFLSGSSNGDNDGDDVMSDLCFLRCVLLRLGGNLILVTR